MYEEDPIARLEELTTEVRRHVERKDWPFAAHVLTDLASEAMTLADKARGGEAAFDPSMSAEY